MSRIAFLFLTIDNINYPAFWEKYFENNYDKINIYCHPKNPKNVTIPWLKKNIIPDLVETGWGYITNAYFNLLSTAMKDKDNIKFITISESCIPLVPFNKLYYNLTENPDKSYIKFMKIKNYDLSARIKNQKNYEKYKLYKHYARFCLSRHHTEKLLSKKKDMEFFNKMHVGDEFFLSLLYPFNNIDDFAITYDNWSYVHHQIDKINKDIKNIYIKIESGTSEVKTLTEKIKSLTKLKEDIGKNPKSYNNVTLEDIKSAKNTGAYFWRKFPKDSNISTYKTDFEILYKQKELYFIHIPKTAGTSIAHVFHDGLNKEIGYGYYRYKNKHIKSKDILDDNLKIKEILNISTWHIPFSFLNKKYMNNIFNKYTLFAIIRNPFDRIVSEYGFWIRYYNNNKHKDYAKDTLKMLKEIYETLEVNPANLNKFIHKILDNKYKYDLDGHLIPMYKYTHIKNNHELILICDILRYENLNNDFNRYIDSYNIKLPKDSLLKTHINRTDTEITRKHLDEKSIKLIQEYYKKDFELFGYDINI